MMGRLFRQKTVTDALSEAGEIRVSERLLRGDFDV